MIDWSSYLLFLAACAALIVTPGPAQALVIARTLSEGRLVGALTAIGLNIGTLFHSIAAALGLSALLASSALAFAVVKYLGATYLVYLGLQALRASPHSAPQSVASRVNTRTSPLSQAVLVGTLNPKVALFFLAFLPQFVDPQHGSVVLQFLVLGATIAVFDILYELVLVQLVFRMQQRVLSSARIALWQSRICGTVLVALGLRLAAQER